MNLKPTLEICPKLNLANLLNLHNPLPSCGIFPQNHMPVTRSKPHLGLWWTRMKQGSAWKLGWPHRHPTWSDSTGADTHLKHRSVDPHKNIQIRFRSGITWPFEPALPLNKNMADLIIISTPHSYLPTITFHPQELSSKCDMDSANSRPVLVPACTLII